MARHQLYRVAAVVWVTASTVIALLDAPTGVNVVTLLVGLALIELALRTRPPDGAG